MEQDGEGFEMVTRLPAAELARLQRRVIYLEAALLQVLGEERSLCEWFTVAELLTFRLPGLPVTRSGLGRHAKDNGWAYRIERGPGGETMLFHFSSLPRRAFEAFIHRVLNRPAAAPDAPAEPKQAGPRRRTYRHRLDKPTPPNTTPQWMLPLLREIRGGASVEEAVRQVAQAGERLTVAEANRVLASYGLRV